MRASPPRSISIRQAPQRRPCSRPAPAPPRGPLAFVERDEIGVQLGDEFVSARDGLVSKLIDLGTRRVARPLGFGQFVLQLVDVRQLAGLLTLQLFTALHDLQQRVLQAGLAPLQCLQLVLQLGELFGVDAARREQRPIAVLALAHRVDLGLELAHLGVEVLQCDLHCGEPVIGLPMRRLRPLDLLLLGQVVGPVIDTA